MATYTGWDHKRDLLVVESVHVIWVIGGLQFLKGEGEVFALKRQRPGHFVGHWKHKIRGGSLLMYKTKHSHQDSSVIGKKHTKIPTFTKHSRDF